MLKEMGKLLAEFVIQNGQHRQRELKQQKHRNHRRELQIQVVTRLQKHKKQQRILISLKPQKRKRLQIPIKRLKQRNKVFTPLSTTQTE